MILIALILIVLIILGVGYIADSVAHAKAAQATIEVARVAEVQAVSNMLMVMVLAIVLLILVIILVGMVILVNRSRLPSREAGAPPILPVFRPQPRFIPPRQHALPPGSARDLEQPQSQALPLVLDELDEEYLRWLQE